jgi:Domain of unknown function (DUF6377)
MKKNLSLILLLLITNALKADTKDSLVINFEKIIEKRNYYSEMKLQKIFQIKKTINDKRFDEETFNKYNALYNEYKTFNYDSAFKYAEILNAMAYKLKDKEKVALAKTNIGFILLSGGMFKETLDTILSTNYIYLKDSVKYIFFNLKARIYHDMADFAANDHFFPIYNTIGNAFLDSALKYTANDSSKYYYLMGLKSLRTNKMREAKKYFEKLIYSFKYPSPDVAIESSCLAFIYFVSGETGKSFNMLVEAAGTDIMLGIKETTAIQNLALWEYRYGNEQKAYKFINMAMDDACFYGARQRKFQISNILPIIEEKRLQEVESEKRQLLIYLICISALVLLLVAFVIIILNLNKKLFLTKNDLAISNEKLSKINNQLGEANQIKEEYIGHFFSTISEYIGKIEKFKRAVERRLITGDIAEIKEFVDKINLKKEREDLYMSFDNIFLKIFPGFIDKFNMLLKEEGRFIIENNQPMLPELRIIALMRLGIDDPEKLARTLNYSIHTIYTYKAKIKSKALMPEEIFESNIMEIKAMVNL